MIGNFPFVAVVILLGLGIYTLIFKKNLIKLLLINLLLCAAYLLLLLLPYLAHSPFKKEFLFISYFNFRHNLYFSSPEHFGLLIITITTLRPPQIYTGNTSCSSYAWLIYLINNIPHII